MMPVSGIGSSMLMPATGAGFSSGGAYGSPLLQQLEQSEMVAAQLRQQAQLQNMRTAELRRVILAQSQRQAIQQQQQARVAAERARQLSLQQQQAQWRAHQAKEMVARYNAQAAALQSEMYRATQQLDQLSWFANIERQKAATAHTAAQQAFTNASQVQLVVAANLGSRRNFIPQTMSAQYQSYNTAAPMTRGWPTQDYSY